MSFRVISVAVWLPVLMLAASIRADRQPTDDNPDSIEIAQCVRFTLPAADKPHAYTVQVKFDSHREQTVSIYVWEPDLEKWERRAFYNSYFQGNNIETRLTLPGGKQVAIVGWHKDADFPESRPLDWNQNPLLASDVKQANPNSPLPTITGRYDDGAAGTANVTLKPEAAAVER